MGLTEPILMCLYYVFFFKCLEKTWEVRKETWKYLKIQYLQLSRLLSILQCNYLQGMEWKWARDFTTMHYQSVVFSLLLTKVDSIFPVSQMTNVKVRQTRKCARSFTASQWENAHSKSGSLGCKKPLLFLIYNMLPRCFSKFGLQKMMSFKGGAFKKLWAVVVCGWHDKMMVLPDTHARTYARRTKLIVMGESLNLFRAKKFFWHHRGQ